MKMEIGNIHVIRIVWRKHLNAYNYIANDEMSKFESGTAEQGVNQSNGVISKIYIEKAARHSRKTPQL
jgi:hypothetical protein